MKKIIIILLLTVAATALGLYFRPSYPLIGQLDWWNVLTKGYFVGAVSGFFSQGFLDESFWYVMRYTMGGLIVGLMIAMAFGGKSSGSAKKKKA
nr:hypothetical protein BHI3_08350 [Bacteriovorax sp. HI3]